MRRAGLFWRVFGAILAVALAAIALTGLVARRALSSAFASYLETLPPRTGMGGGMGRQMMLGTAEQAFLAGVDRGIAISAVVAIALAALGAWLLARHLTDPLRRLTGAARALAAGDLEHRVVTEGPAEVLELAEAFNGMADSLQEAEALRRRMVADVAHELRNPIAALRAQVEGVAEGVLPADDAHLASLVEDVGTLSRLVDDVQELSVAEAGRLRYEVADFDVCAVVAAEIDRVRILAQPGVLVSASCPEHPVIVGGDEFRVAQVVRNLLSNAARHTRHGSVSVAVEQDGGLVRVTVTDTGEGISAADLPHIWERFYRADASRAASTGGTGVGLAIARRIVEDHGGRVLATSEPGAGSTVGFEVPVRGIQSEEA